MSAQTAAWWLLALFGLIVTGLIGYFSGRPGKIDRGKRIP